MRTITLLGLILSAFLPFSTTALAAVDLEVPINSTVRGTFSSSGVAQTYRFEATAGTLLNLAVGGKGLDVAISLADPKGTPVSVTDARGYRDGGSKVLLRKFPLQSTGLWMLVVSSDVNGPYSLKLKGKAGKSAGGTVTLPAGESTTLSFAAPAGSVVTLKAKAAKGSAAEPRFGDFDGEDLTDAGKSSSKGHAVKVAGVSGGDLELIVGNLGAASGDVAVKIKVKAPKVRMAKVDVSAANLGEPADGGTALGRTVDADAGGQVEIDDAESSIDGASVDVASGALPENTTITIASAPAVSTPEDRQAAGPAVAFGPPGLTFAKPVTLTLPYDPSAVPAGSDEADLRVLHVESNGDTETLIPTAVDKSNHELTVETSSISKFMPIAPKGPPNLEGRQYWAMLLDYEFEADFDDNDSRYRSAIATTGVITLGAPGAEESSLRGKEHEIQWGHEDDDAGHLLTEERAADVDFAWNYLPGNQSIEVVVEGRSTPWALGANGAIFISGTDAEAGEPLSQLKLLIEKPKTARTLASMAGDFWVIQFGLEVSGDSGPLHFMTDRIFGSVTLKKDGTLIDTSSARFCEFDGSGDEVFCATDSWEDPSQVRFAGPEGGIFEGAMIVTWKDDDGIEHTLTLLPSADGNIFMGADDRGGRVVAVRKGSGMSPAKVAGDYRLAGLDMELITYQGTGTTLGDVEMSSFEGTVTIAAKGSIDFETNDRLVMRDGSQPGGVLIDEADDSGGTRIKVASMGGLVIDSEGDDTIGGFTPDGLFAIAHDSPATPHGIVGIVFLLRSP